jgi:HEAT repeat protein
MSSKEKFEAQLAAIEALRQKPAEAVTAPLRAALKQRNNYLVAKAADLIAARRIEELLPELLTAFDRFFENAEKSDPQCWAKNSLSRALAAFELQEPTPFLRGLRHVQMEPVWGGISDTAGPLRGICALGLVQCRSVPETDLLRYLIDVLADKEKAARGDAVRGLAQVGSHNAALLLRLRALMGGEDADVLGACYAAVLDIEGTSALSWVVQFLAEEDDAAGEAALAIASTHTAEAFTILRECWAKTRDPWFRTVLLSAMALTRQSDATEFLLDLVKSDPDQSHQAIEAILRALPSEEVTARLKTLVQGDSRLERVFAMNAVVRS